MHSFHEREEDSVFLDDLGDLEDEGENKYSERLLIYSRLEPFQNTYIVENLKFQHSYKDAQKQGKLFYDTEWK